MPRQLVLILADHDGETIAGALCLRGLLTGSADPHSDAITEAMHVVAREARTIEMPAGLVACGGSA